MLSQLNITVCSALAFLFMFISQIIIIITIRNCFQYYMNGMPRVMLYRASTAHTRTHQITFTDIRHTSNNLYLDTYIKSTTQNVCIVFLYRNYHVFFSLADFTMVKRNPITSLMPSQWCVCVIVCVRVLSIVIGQIHSTTYAYRAFSLIFIVYKNDIHLKWCRTAISIEQISFSIEHFKSKDAKLYGYDDVGIDVLQFYLYSSRRF